MDGKSPAPGPLKPRLLALVEQGEIEQRAFIEKLSAAERAAVGAPDAWAAKDHVAHNAAWKADAAREIVAALHGEAYHPESITTFNPRAFSEYQHDSWDAVLAAAERADEALRAAIEECTEEDLNDPARFPWRDGIPLWCTAQVSGYEHPAEHYAQFYVDRGAVERARAVREEAVENARRLIGEKEELGYMVYNLGCFYSNIGQPALAIAALRDSFASTPHLREGVLEDPELRSLRDYPDFQALAGESA